MLNLYWKTGEQTVTLVAKPFPTETALESYVLQNQDILGGDIYIIHRQIRTGSKEGIPDMIGVDQDSRVCIIELKNVEADESILPQALGYAIWAETNPDSIKAIWLESKQKPEDISIDWDNMDLRVILIAPSFKRNVLRMAGKIGYPVDLVQIQRYCAEDHEFLLVEVLEDEQKPKAGVTTVKQDWDWEYYESEHGKDATAQFRAAVEALERFVQKQGWDLPYNLNKYSAGFKLGNKVVFEVAWGGTYAWHVRAKLPKETAEGFKGEHWEFQRYDSSFHQALFRPLQPNEMSIEKLEPFLIEAYRYVSGTK